MAANEIHYYDAGTIIEVTVKDDTTAVNLTTASLCNFEFTKPSRANVTVAASFSASGADGKLRWITTPCFLNEIGDWKLQVYIDLPTGTWHSDIKSFRVYGNL